jgi:cytochrome c oxidase subunit 3
MSLIYAFRDSHTSDDGDDCDAMPSELSRSWGNNPENHHLHDKTGLRILLLVISSLFFLFIVAFLIRSQLSDWEHLSEPWKPLAHPWQLWVNTGVLVMASICFQGARYLSRKPDDKKKYFQKDFRNAYQSLILGGMFTLLFLAGQLYVWRELIQLGYYVNGNPANSFFYLFTGMHGLHLLGGMVAWSLAVVKVWQGAPLTSMKQKIDLCAIYWHYMLGLWLVLMFFLTSSPETYATLARLCGL